MSQAPVEDEPAATRPRGRHGRRANDLDGAEWTRYSISVWSDIRKTSEEAALKHPAMFPVMLAARLIRCFTRGPGGSVLDPFAGSGSTLVAARELGRSGIGFEVCDEYVELARGRVMPNDGGQSAKSEGRRASDRGEEEDHSTLDIRHSPVSTVHRVSAARIPEVLEAESIDFCVTSPPYWDILSQRRSADGKEVRDYGAASEDLSREPDYEAFVERLGAVFDGVYTVLKPGAYCVVNVMDLRKKSRFYPLHSDLAARLSDPARGGRFLYDDLIVWDRRADYNNLRPLGYPAVFRINKVHEFLLIFRKAV
jgi:DNA modification methylase